MRIFITGGAGYVGWSLVSRLARAPEVNEIIVYDNFSRKNYALFLADKGPGFDKIGVTVADILDSRSLAREMARADCLCHLAATAPSPFSDEHPHYFDQINHWGSAEVVRAAEINQSPRIIYVSSGAVYGHGSRPFRTSDPPTPDASYGISKLAGERQFLRLASAAEVIVLRAGTVYGFNPAMRFDTFVNRFALDATLRRPMLIHGSGTQLRPIIHIDDLAAVIADCCLGRVSAGTINVLAENVSVHSVADTVQGLLPASEKIYVNQGQRLRDLALESNLAAGITHHSRRDLGEGIAHLLTALSLDH